MTEELPGTRSLRHAQNQKYCVFDTETCSVNLVSAENIVWNLSYLITNRYNILEQHEFFPYFPEVANLISIGAQQVTGFNPIEYKQKGQDPVKVWNKFSKVLEDENIILVGQNIINFDFHVLRQLSKRMTGKTIPWEKLVNRCIDTNCLAKAAALGVKLPPFHDTENFMFAQFKLAAYHERGLKTSLKVLAKNYNIVVDESRLHGALYDVVLNYEVFKKQLVDLNI